MTQLRRDRPAHWFWGLVLGVATAFLLATGGTIGLIFWLAAGIGGWLLGRSLAFESGLLVGIGGTWLALLTRAALECPVGSSDCFVPDQTPWVIVFSAVLVVGGLVGLLGLRRARSV